MTPAVTSLRASPQRPTFPTYSPCSTSTRAVLLFTNTFLFSFSQAPFDSGSCGSLRREFVFFQRHQDSSERKTDDVLRSQKVIFSRTQLFERFPDAPRQSSCVWLSQLVFQPGRFARRAGLPLIVTSVRWHLHPLLLFQASGNFLTTGQAPALCTNKLQIAAL